MDVMAMGFEPEYAVAPENLEEPAEWCPEVPAEALLPHIGIEDQDFHPILSLLDQHVRRDTRARAGGDSSLQRRRPEQSRAGTVPDIDLTGVAAGPAQAILEDGDPPQERTRLHPQQQQNDQRGAQYQPQLQRQQHQPAQRQPEVLADQSRRVAVRHRGDDAKGPGRHLHSSPQQRKPGAAMSFEEAREQRLRNVTYGRQQGSSKLSSSASADADNDGRGWTRGADAAMADLASGPEDIRDPRDSFRAASTLGKRRSSEKGDHGSSRQTSARNERAGRGRFVSPLLENSSQESQSGDDEGDRHSAQPARKRGKKDNLASKVNQAVFKRKSRAGGRSHGGGGRTKDAKKSDSDGEPERNPIMDHELLKNCDENMVETILNEVLEGGGGGVSWDDIAGLNFAKDTVREMVINPLLRPDIYTGIRAPPKGLLLFGPPGTGKTMIAKAMAKQSNFTFFNISASTLTSKWIGEGEKMVKTLFAVARIKSPSVVFIDEIDSLLTARSDTENEASRRMKTEFLVCMDGVGADFDQNTLDDPEMKPGSGRVLLVGATNRPQELDDAARRRLVKRLYIPLPDREARAHMIRHLMKSIDHSLVDADLEQLVDLTPGYSGADMKGLCQEAAQLPVRGIDLATARAEDVRPVSVDDFCEAARNCKPSVSPADLGQYRDWNNEFGSFQFKEEVLDMHGGT